MTSNVFVGGALPNEAQQVAQSARILKHPEIFHEGGYEWQQHWRSRHCIVFSRDEPGGTEHNFFAYRLAVVGGEEIRGDLLIKTPSLDSAIDACAKVEDFA